MGNMVSRVEGRMLDRGEVIERLPEDVQRLDITDPDYPAALRALPWPPESVYVAGGILPADGDAVAVVGSRQADAQALSHAFAIGAGLARRGHTVVSGLALGVDAAAHRGALSVLDGRTIAVVGTGLLATFPPEHAGLDRVIRTRGAVVSQFRPGDGPTRKSFPARNALIAALATGSVVVVAGERSGTRIEIDDTIALGKPVVFWGPRMRTARWANRLVESGVACFADSIDDIVERLSTIA